LPDPSPKAWKTVPSALSRCPGSWTMVMHWPRLWTTCDPLSWQLRAKHGPLITPPWPSALAQRERSLFACCVEAARQPNHLGTGPHTTSSHAIYLLGWNASICDPVPKECATDHSSFALCAGSLAPCAQSLCTPVACHVNRQLFAVQPSEVDSM